MRHSATEEALKGLGIPLTPLAMEGLENVKPRSTPGFQNVYHLVEDGRTAEQMVMDWLRANGKGEPISLGCTRGPRGWVMPQIELATALIKSLEEVENFHNLPVEEQMRQTIADAIEDVEYAEHILGRRPRDVRFMSDEKQDSRVQAELMRSAADTLESAIMQLSNWTRNERTPDGTWRFPHKERANAVSLRVWAKLAEIEGRFQHGFTWEPITTAPAHEWILLKSMVGRPLILKSASDVIVVGDEQELVFSDTDWLTLDGKPVKINAHGAQWMRMMEQPTFDAEGFPHFRSFD